jgi:hypothetical protein
MKVHPIGVKKLFSVGGSESIQPTRARVRATAQATVEPSGPRTPGAKREHTVTVVVELDQADAARDQAQVTAIARDALAAYAPRAGDADRRAVREVGTTRRGKNGTTTTVISAIEAQVVWPARPSAASVEALGNALYEHGYRVTVRERRECASERCTVDTMVEWNHLAEVPTGWTSNTVCGRHGYKVCTSCQSQYLCTATNAAGQAPSVYCTVCDAVLIEWGSSKVWEAQLVARGEGAVAARGRRRPAG